MKTLVLLRYDMPYASISYCYIIFFSCLYRELSGFDQNNRIRIQSSAWRCNNLYLRVADPDPLFWSDFSWRSAPGLVILTVGSGSGYTDGRIRVNSTHIRNTDWTFGVCCSFLSGSGRLLAFQAENKELYPWSVNIDFKLLETVDNGIEDSFLFSLRP